MDKMPVYLFVVLMLVILLLTTGCVRTVELLDGLCYNDRDGTFVCLDQTINEEPKPKGLNCDSRGLVEYCEGRTESTMACRCINHNDMEDMTDFLWH